MTMRTAAVALCLVMLGPPARVAGQASAIPHYVCPPCGMKCDDRVYDAPGVCPVCGAALVEQGSPQLRGPRAKVAVLVFEGVELIDVTGPWEVFGAAGFEVFTVAATRAPVTTVYGMTIVPRFTFADAPAAEVLLVPGGGIKRAQDDAATLQWLRSRAAASERVLSVCNGAFLLGSAGLLNGLKATTTAPLLEKLHEAFPKVQVVPERLVDNGKIVTAAGLSSGIDGALHLVEQMLHRGTAQATALAIEYDWQPEKKYARAALADRLIPDLNWDTWGTWELVSTQGGTVRWEMVLTTDASPERARDVVSGLEQALAKTWTLRNRQPGESHWRFADGSGQPWTGTLLWKVTQATGRLSVTVRVEHS